MQLDLSDEALVRRLQEIYLAERQLLLIWGELILRSHNRAITLSLAEYQAETARQVARLEECLELVGSPVPELGWSESIRAGAEVTDGMTRSESRELDGEPAAQVIPITRAPGWRGPPPTTIIHE
jgi:ferritin-like metal-binding protein YciE